MKPELGQLPRAWQTPLQEFLALLQSLAGEHLRAVAVIGELDEPSVRSVVVLDEIDLDFVRLLGAQGASLGRMRVQAPLLMTPEYIRASLDAFPIELLDIQQRQVHILGENFFAPLGFKKTDVRLELERELKREMILIRQGVLSAGDRDRVLAEVHAGATDQTLRLLRALLWLHDRPPAAATAALIRTAGELTALDMSALSTGAFGRGEAFHAVESLYELVIRLGNFVDRMQVAG